jgi:hypothetical protein
MSTSGRNTPGAQAYKALARRLSGDTVVLPDQPSVDLLDEPATAGGGAR